MHDYRLHWSEAICPNPLILVEIALARATALEVGDGSHVRTGAAAETFKAHRL